MFSLARRAKALRARRQAHRFGGQTGEPVVVVEKGQPGSQSRPLRREARLQGGAQPLRGHRRETRDPRVDGGSPTWIGTSVPGQERISEPRLEDGCLRSIEASVSGETGRPGGCGQPRTPGQEWRFVTSPQTPRGRDHGRASSGFCARGAARWADRTLAKLTGSSRKRTSVMACAPVHSVPLCFLPQRGDPKRAPKGDRRRVGVKSGKDLATGPPEGATARWSG